MSVGAGLRIAAFQRHAILDDGARLGDRIAADLDWAAGEGIDLALFPEGWLLGHSYDPASIAARADAVSGGVLAALCARIADAAPAVVIGGFERRGDGAILNSAFVIERGVVVGRYAKAHPNEPGVTAGSAHPVFERAGRRYGIAICNDANHEGPAARLAEQGAGLILYPLNNMLSEATAMRWRTKSIANLRARARQTRCWVASADVTGRHDGRVSFGCTAIVGPDGAVVARVDEGREGVATFELPAPKYSA